MKTLLALLLIACPFVVPILLHWRIAQVWVAAGAAGVTLTSLFVLIEAMRPGRPFGGSWAQFLAVTLASLMFTTAWSGLFGLLFAHSKRNQEADLRYFAADPRNHRDLVLGLGTTAIGLVCVWVFSDKGVNWKAMLGYVAFAIMGLATLYSWKKSPGRPEDVEKWLRGFAHTRPLGGEPEEPEAPHTGIPERAAWRRAGYLAVALTVIAVAGAMYLGLLDPLKLTTLAGPLAALFLVFRFAWRQARPGPKSAQFNRHSLSSGRVAVHPAPHPEEQVRS